MKHITIQQEDIYTGKITMLSKFDFTSLGWYGHEDDYLASLRAGKMITFNGYQFKEARL